MKRRRHEGTEAQRHGGEREGLCAGSWSHSTPRQSYAPIDKRLLSVTSCLRAFVPLCLCLFFCSGCPQYRDANVPNRIQRQTDPYYLYTPSNYDRAYKWPLIILCHGTKPWDNAKRQMLDWVKLSEERGFIVAAPELSGTSKFPSPSLPDQLAKQLEDERRILNTVRHVRAAYNISDDRIFLTGWSAGGYAVLYTGLKHPEIFRALAVQQGNFEASYLTDLVGKIDRHTPVCLIHGSLDALAGAEPRACADWLDEQRANLFELDVAGGHRGHPKLTQEFFERVLRRMPWLRIRGFAAGGSDPLTVQFKTRGSVEPLSYQWSFGDGGESPVAEPVHRYAKPGTYHVSLIAVTPDDQTLQRSLELEVPVFEGITPQPTTWDEPSR